MRPPRASSFSHGEKGRAAARDEGVRPIDRPDPPHPGPLPCGEREQSCAVCKVPRFTDVCSCGWFEAGADMNEVPKNLSRMERIAAATPDGAARRIRSLSDRAIAWIFIAPTVILLLAINIFPLIWAIRLSF